MGARAGITLPQLWIALAILLPVLAALLAPLSTVDLAYQLRAGAGMLDGTGLPARDTWTFTAAGEPWLDQQWAAQVLLAWIHRAAGWDGLIVLRAGLVGAWAVLLVTAIRRSGPGLGLRSVALLALAAFVVAAPALALRPQLLAMVLFAGAIALLAGRDRSPRAVWLLVPMTIAWANVHGSFVLAPLLAGFAWLEGVVARTPRARADLGLGIAVLGATLVNPWGIGAWAYVFDLSTRAEVTERVAEWQPPLPWELPGALFWWSAALVVVALAVVARRRWGALPPWPALVRLGAFAALAARTARGIAWWPVIAAVEVATALDAAPAGSAASPRRRLTPRIANTAVVGVLALAIVALLPTWQSHDVGTGAPAGRLALAPLALTSALRGIATAEDRVWNPQVWGSWLEFAVPAPAYALDSRIEVIPAAVWREADVIGAAAPGWGELLDARGVTIVVTMREQAALEAALAASAAWTLIYGDEDGSVFARTRTARAEDEAGTIWGRVSSGA